MKVIGIEYEVREGRVTQGLRHNLKSAVRIILLNLIILTVSILKETSQIPRSME